MSLGGMHMTLLAMIAQKLVAASCLLCLLLETIYLVALPKSGTKRTIKIIKLVILGLSLVNDTVFTL